MNFPFLSDFSMVSLWAEVDKPLINDFPKTLQSVGKRLEHKYNKSISPKEPPYQGEGYWANGYSSGSLGVCNHSDIYKWNVHFTAFSKVFFFII